MCSRSTASLFLALPLAVLLPAAGSAQSVTGTVTDAATGESISAAHITLERLPDGDAVARTLSRGDGRFRVAADAPGRYRLRVQRLGFAEHVGETILLEGGAPTDRRIALRTRAIEIDGVVARGQRRCVLRPEEGEATQELWEQARAVLAVADAMEEDDPMRFRVRTWERVIDPDSDAVVEHRGRRGYGYGREAFTDHSPERLAERGFVRALPDGGREYAGLSGRVLLSDAFLDGHCFRVTVSDASANEGLVGLAFEPLRGTRRPDVRGVLWMDAETYALSHTEYTYTDHLVPVRLPLERFGGRTEFRELPDGAWIVDRWWIRMPLAARSTTSDDLPEGTIRRQPVAVPFGLSRPEEVRFMVKEVGGEVLREGEPDGPPPAVLTGVVTDRIGSPLPGATVFLSGTSHSETTDAAGRYEMEVLVEGEFQLAVSHPEFDGRLLDQRIRDVELRAGESQRIIFRAGERVQRVAAADSPTAEPVCDPEATGTGGVSVSGRVVEMTTGVPLAGAEVRASVDRRGTELTTRSGGDGTYRFCGVPWTEHLDLSASLAEVAGTSVTVRMQEASTRVVRDIGLGVNRPGALTGRVVRGDALRPMARVEVRVLGETERSAMTNRDGRFFIDDLEPGPHRVALRHIGLEADTVVVEVRGGAATEVELRADARVFELEPVVVQGTHRGLLRDFKHRQARSIGGHFVGREEIESRAATRTAQLLQEIPGLRVSTGPHQATLVYTARSIASIQDGSLCAPMLYVDGVRVGTTADQGRDGMLDVVHPASIEGIEVYLGAASLPAEYSGSTGGCGVIGIWTRRGPE